jgi:hypothetical protein
LSWFLDSRLPQAFAINLSIENFLVSGSYCQSDKEGVFVKPLSCIASGVLLNPNSGYSYYQAEGISVGSGEIESTVKQMGRRVKISGAQWDEDNVQSVLWQRCAYLNGELSR